MSFPSHEESNGGEELTENIVLKKGPWTSEEDRILAAYVRRHGVGNWNEVRKNTGLARCGKSCRLRWSNHLRSDLRRGPFSEEEQRKVIELHALMGNKWARMAQELPGRTDNEIKNFWHTRSKKRKRLGLPIYPDNIKQLWNINNQENEPNVSTHQANDSQPNSFKVPNLSFDCSNLNQNQPLHLPPFLDMTYMPTFEQQDSDHQLHSNLLHNDSNTCKDNAAPTLIDQSSLYIEQPPIPSFDDTTREDLPGDQTQFYKPLSPCSNGFLESIFYTPKVLEASDDCSMLPCETQMDSNSLANRDNSHQRYHTLTKPSASPYFSNWSENYDEDQYNYKDTLYALIQPYVKKDT